MVCFSADADYQHSRLTAQQEFYSQTNQDLETSMSLLHGQAALLLDPSEYPYHGTRGPLYQANLDHLSKRTLNVESPAFTPATLPGPVPKAGTFTSQVAATATFTPRAPANGLYTPATLYS